MIRIRNALIMTSLLMTLLKLDFFFVFSFAAQLIPSQDLGYDHSVTETVLVFILGGVGLALALVAVYRENKYAMGAFIGCGTLAIAYFIYRITVIARPRLVTDDPYLHTRQFLIFTTVLAAALLLATIIVACKCFWNVHNGLVIFKDTAMHKNKVYGNHEAAIDHESLDDGYEMSGKPNASKTLLEVENSSPGTHSKTQQANIWAIE